MKKFTLLLALASMLILSACQQEKPEPLEIEISSLEYSFWEGTLKKDREGTITEYPIYISFYQEMPESDGLVIGVNLKVTTESDSNSATDFGQYYQNDALIDIDLSGTALSSGSYWVTSYTGKTMRLEEVYSNAKITIDLIRKSVE